MQPKEITERVTHFGKSLD